MSNDSKSSSLPPAVGEFAIEDRQRLLGRIAELEEALELADRGVANCEVFRQRLAKYEDEEGRPVQPSMPDALAKIGSFLLGEGEIDGHSFGDARPDMDGMFWWRKELRTALESQALEIERLKRTIDAGTENELALIGERSNLQAELAALKAQPSDYEAAMAQQRARINASMANTLKAQPGGVVLPEQAKDALEWIDDFIARCNGDDRGACESVNVIRNSLAMQSSVDKEDLRDLLDALVFADVRRVKNSGVWHEELHQRAIDMLAILNSSPVTDNGAPE